VRRRAAVTFAGALAVAVGLALYRFDPAVTRLFPPCPFRALTGWQCPGCGTTRAVHALLHGDVGRALELNPLTTLGLPLLAVGALQELRRWCWGATPAGLRLPAWLIGALAGVLVGFAVLRNVAP